VVNAETRRVTLVADQLLGYHRTGGLGTATTFLALALARMCHDVEVLYFGDVPTEPVDAEWTALYDGAGVAIRLLPALEAEVEPPYFRRMRAVELALRARPPDVAIVQDIGAPGYSALRLRRLGLAFENTMFIVFCHGTRQWITNMSRKVRVLPGALAVSVLERAGVELADVAISPSAYMIDWMRGQGWQLPRATGVIPLLTRSVATGKISQPTSEYANGKVERLAFFGRLEERKGVQPFVAGLNAVPPELLRGVEVEFLGRATTEYTPEHVESLLSEPVLTALDRVTFETDLDQHEALARLSRPGTLAIVPSLEDNSPNVVYECIEQQIPFIASALGGTGELVAPEDRDRVLFEPTPEGVAEALQRALTGKSSLRPARPGFDGELSLERWAEVVAMRAPAVEPLQVRPAVDAVVVQRASSERLERCLSALGVQTYAELRQPIVIRTDGRSVDAARQAGLASVEAPWVVLLDEDDVPEPDLVETLVRSQAAASADVVTCGVYLGDGASSEHYFLGQPGALGLLRNDYGTTALIRTSILGDGRDPWEAKGDADWPLLARLSAAGAKVVSVPLPLVQQSSQPGTLGRDPADGLLVVEHVEHTLPRPFHGLARAAAGLAAEVSPRAFAPRRGIVRRGLRKVLRPLREAL
jgi:O-antigen biosynthesis protein